MNHSAICAESLTRDFGAIRAVDALTMEVPAGIVFGFLGPNGSGKTTAIRLLLGLLEPTSGQAQVLGFDTRKQADGIRERAGALLEHSGLYERLTAEDNLDFYGRAWRMSAAERQARSHELLGRVGLWERRREPVATWSRGMKQKLALARALFHRPALLFLDEPTAGLDPAAAAEVREGLAELTERQGVTVFLTTHNLAEAEKLCQQVAVIRGGRLLAVGRPDELRTTAAGGQLQAEITGRGFSEHLAALLRARPEVSTVRLDSGRLCLTLQGKVPLAPLISLLVGHGAEIEEVRKSIPNLEDVFLKLMEEET